MTKTEKELEEIVKPKVEQLGYELYDVEFLKEGSEWFLRLYIDSNEKKIGIEDCEKVSGVISDLLDEKDPISTAYNLEVSSCGLERHLREVKHYEAVVGEKIELRLFTQFKGKKTYCGKLLNVSEGKITILDDDTSNQEEIEFSNISSAKKIFNWEE